MTREVTHLSRHGAGGARPQRKAAARRPPSIVHLRPLSGNNSHVDSSCKNLSNLPGASLCVRSALVECPEVWSGGNSVDHVSWGFGGDCVGRCPGYLVVVSEVGCPVDHVMVSWVGCPGDLVVVSQVGCPVDLVVIS